jgi:tyrosyl-DNA phosphodiesterase 2
VLSWIRRRAVPVAGAAGGVAGDALVLTTFNVWFDERHARARYQAIADLLAVDRPDVMVFQEVTDTAVDVLLGQDWIRGEYVRAAVTGRRTGNYGHLLLSRVPISRAVYVPLPTNAQRGVLRAEVNVGGVPLVVGSVHLDSGKKSAGLRKRQLRRTFRDVGRFPDVVLLGDFNMRDDENSLIVPPFEDVWPVLRPDEPGYTEDTSINMLRLDSTGKERHVRFDRVLVKGWGWQPASIDLLGTEPISPDLPRVFPSDHLGEVSGGAAAGTSRRSSLTGAEPLVGIRFPQCCELCNRLGRH